MIEHIMWQAPYADGAHSLIRGDSQQVLPLLTGNGYYDLAYLDPPYATGSQKLTYSDSLTVTQWCDLFSNIVENTVKLLNPKRACPVLVSIDDNRIIQARTILDRAIPGGFIATIICQGSVRPGAQLVSVGHEYLLIYMTRAKKYRRSGVRWRVTKPGATTVLKKAEHVWKQHWLHTDTASQTMREWYREHRSDPEIWRLREYKWFTLEGRLYRRGPINGPRGTKHYQYPIVAPTGKIWMPDEWGWRMPATTWNTWAGRDETDFGPDNTLSPARRIYLDEHCLETPTSLDIARRSAATRKLSIQLGDSGFSCPKNPELLAKWIHITTDGRTGLRVLDPFAGAATIIEALEQLNQQDGGNRVATCIQIDERDLDTANKVSIFDSATLPRALRVCTKYGSRLNVGELVETDPAH